MNLVLYEEDRNRYLWSHLKLLEWLAATIPPKSETAWLKLSEELKDTKRRIRENRDESILKGKLIKDYGIDGYLERIDLPEVKTQAEAMEYCRKITFDYGRILTAWARVVKRGHGYAIYHRVITEFDI